MSKSEYVYKIRNTHTNMFYCPMRQIERSTTFIPSRNKYTNWSKDGRVYTYLPLNVVTNIVNNGAYNGATDKILVARRMLEIIKYSIESEQRWRL